MASVKENGKKPAPCRHHMTIMRELFEHIDATGMKRGKFAARAGYAHTSLCHYASGQSTPNLQAFLNLCEAAGVQVTLTPLPQEVTMPRPNDHWKKYEGDFNSMSDEDVERERNRSLNEIEELEDWVEAVASWEAAGKPRKENRDENDLRG